MIPVRNPRTGEIDFQIKPLLGAALTSEVTRLRTGQKIWAARSVEDRSAVLTQFARIIAEDSTNICAALQIDTARKTLAQVEIDGLVGMLHRWANTAPTLLTPHSAQSDSLPSVQIETNGVARGVVGVISPWNFPLLLSFIDAIPALAAGCAVLIKPSEVTPRFVDPVRASIERIPELKDAIGFAQGDGQTGAELIEHVDMVCFTGSVATGRKVASGAAAAFIPASLELGGKDPAIICADADIARAASAIMRSAAGATGQGCQSLERLYVEKSVHDALRDALVVEAENVALSLTDPDRGQMGPFIFCKQAAIVGQQLQDALDKGAEICTGDLPAERGGGYWMRPTVLTGVTHEMTLMQQETFGPVLPLIPFDDDASAVALANDSPFGLSGAVFSADLDRARSIARQMNGGAISINDAGLTAFVFDAPKDSFAMSGIGASRTGTQAILRFLRNQSLLINTAPPIPIAAFSERG